MAEVTEGQSLRIWTGTQDHQFYQIGIEKTGISRGSADETVSGIKTFTGNNTHSGTEAFNGPVTFGALSGQILYYDTILTPTTIVGTAANDLGHASGTELVPAPGAGLMAEFISSIFRYDFGVAGYTAGGNDLHVLYPGFASLSGNIAAADLLAAAGDKTQVLYALTTAGISIPVNTGINLASTAWTNTGSSTSVVRVRTHYRVHATGF